MINRSFYILLNDLTMSPYQCVRDNGEIIVNTSLGLFSVILPKNPILGTTILVVDATGTASTNNIIITSNYQQINGQPSFTLDQDYGAVRFIYDNMNNDQVAIVASGSGGGLPTPTLPNTILASDGSAFVETDVLQVDATNEYVNINNGFHLSGYQTINTTLLAINDNVSMVGVDSTASSITCYLPATPLVGHLVSVKDVAGTSSGNPITITSVFPALIDGSNSFIIAVPYEAFTFYFNGTNQELR